MAEVRGHLISFRDPVLEDRMSSIAIKPVDAWNPTVGSRFPLEPDIPVISMRSGSAGCKYGYKYNPFTRKCMRTKYQDGQQPGAFRKMFGFIFPYTTTQRTPQYVPPIKGFKQKGENTMTTVEKNDNSPDYQNSEEHNSLRSTDPKADEFVAGKGADKQSLGSGQWAVNLVENNRTDLEWSLEAQGPSQTTEKPKKQKQTTIKKQKG